MSERAQQKAILFFDGVCTLCNGAVDFVIKRDTQKIFRYSPLQGDTAKKYVPDDYREQLGTLILSINDKLYFRSDAVLKIAENLNGLWPLMRVFWLLPRPLRDLVYRFVAHNRYRFFGQKDTCRIPSPEERALFLP